MGYVSLWNSNKLIFEAGSLGVIFFFVLSGFLITYLLLKEKSLTGTVAVRKFYLRRIFRIWPLYYLIVLSGFLLLPHFHIIELPYLNAHLSDGYGLKFLLYVIMLPNLAFAMFVAVPHIGQTWSIGVEEQFYLLWPLLIKHSKNIIRMLFSVIGILVTMKAVVLYLSVVYPANETLLVLKPFLAMTKMESMAIGGLGAWFLFDKEKIKILYSNVLMFISIVSVVLMVYFVPDILQNGAYLIYSVLFLIIILNVSCNPHCILKLENKLFVMLGNISYGIYMYHMLMIAVVLGYLNKWGFAINNGWKSQTVVYAGTITLTVLVAWISYNLFEKKILRLKTRFTIIQSGSVNDVRELHEQIDKQQ